MSERVFIDTSAFYAINDPHDANHGAAVATLRRLIQEGAQTCTTNSIVAETHTLLLNRRGHAVAVQVLDRIDASTTRIIRATEGDEHRGREIVRQHTDKDYSLVDAISFALMERLHLRRAWAYDQHFSQFGWTQTT